MRAQKLPIFDKKLFILKFFFFRLTFTPQMENSGIIFSSNAMALFREGLKAVIKINILILLKVLLIVIYN